MRKFMAVFLPVLALVSTVAHADDEAALKRAKEAKQKGATYGIRGIQCIGSHCEPMTLNMHGSICPISDWVRPAPNGRNCPPLNEPQIIVTGIPDRQRRVYMLEPVFVKSIGYEDVVVPPNSVVVRVKKYKFVMDPINFYGHHGAAH